MFENIGRKREGATAQASADAPRPSIQHRAAGRGRAQTRRPQAPQPQQPPTGKWTVDTIPGALEGTPETFVVEHSVSGQRFPFGTDREGAYKRAQVLNEAGQPLVCSPSTIGHLKSMRAGLDAEADQLAEQRAQREAECRDLWRREQRLRGVSADYGRIIRGAAFVPASLGEHDQHQAPVDPDDVQEDGDPCFGCGRPGETRMCFNQVENRRVPLCPRCHPSADDIDDSGADGEEPERIEPDLPEALTSGPAAVPQLNPAAFGDTMQQVFRVADESMPRRSTPDPTDGEADTVQFRRVNGAGR